MAYRRSLDFLPSVFRTEVNDKFLHATVDQLVSEPELKRIDGYIGRRFSPVAGLNDSFINEFTTLRQNYQLEPNTTYIDETGKVKFTASYVDLLRRIDTLGGFTNDHSRLFSDTSYNYDAYIDYDKQFEKVFSDALQIVIEPLKWKTQEETSLEDFFG